MPRFEPRRNPWDLTPAEVRAVMLCGVLGRFEEVAAVTGKSAETVKNQVYKARKKMEVTTIAQAVLRLERWRRGWQVARCAKDVA